MELSETGIRGRFTHVYHIADIHIRRADDRATEFDHVVSNLIQILKDRPAVSESRALLVIAGDIFDDKDALTHYSANAFAGLLRDLSALLPVIMIPGNHDFRQSRPDRPDRIAGMLEMMTMLGTSPTNAIAYLRESGAYRAGNVCVCTSSVYDTLSPSSEAGNVDVMPAFPQPVDDPTIDFSIAVAHSTVRQVSDGAREGARDQHNSEFGCSLAWFGSHTMILLGDEHIARAWRPREGTIAAQPGSLLTHSYGEPTLGHSCLEWTLATTAISHFEIANKFARVSMVRLPAGISGNSGMGGIGVRMHGSGRSRLAIDVASAIKLPRFPSQPRMRLLDGILEHEAAAALGPNITVSEYTINRIAAAASAASRGYVATEHTDDADSIRAHAHVPAIIRWVRDNTADEALADSLEAVLRSPSEELRLPPSSSLLGNKSARAVEKKCDQISRSLEAYSKALQAPLRRLPFRILELDARWLGRYRELRLDFHALPATVLVDGPNNAGKSTMIDAIHIALFGRTSDTREEYRDGSEACPFVNAKIPSAVCATTRIVVRVGEQEHVIERKFQRDRDGGFKQTSKSSGPAPGRFPRVTSVAKSGDAEAPVIYLIGKVGDWVDAHVGTIHDVSMGAILSQSNASSFFKADTRSRKDLLERHTGLDAIKHLEDAICAHRQGLAELVKESSLAVTLSQSNAPPCTTEQDVKVVRDALQTAVSDRDRASAMSRDIAKNMHNFGEAARIHDSSTRSESDARRELEVSRGRFRAMMDIEGADPGAGEDLEALVREHSDVQLVLAKMDACAPHIAKSAMEAAQDALDRAKADSETCPLLGTRKDANASLEEVRTSIKCARDHVTGIPKPDVPRPARDHTDVAASPTSRTVGRAEIDELRMRVLPTGSDLSLYESWKARDAKWRTLLKRVGADTAETATAKLWKAERVKELMGRESATMADIGDLAKLRFDRTCACCTSNIDALDLGGRTRTLGSIQAELDAIVPRKGRSAQSAEERVLAMRSLLASATSVEAQRSVMEDESQRWTEALANDFTIANHRKHLAKVWWDAYDRQEIEMASAQRKADQLSRALDFDARVQETQAQVQTAKHAHDQACASREAWQIKHDEMREAEEQLSSRIDRTRKRRDDRAAARDRILEARDQLAYIGYLGEVEKDAKLSELSLTLQSQLARLEQEHAAHLAHSATDHELASLRELVSEKLRVAEALRSIFCCEKTGGYSWHVHREIVLPKIAAVMNEFLAKAGDFRMHVHKGDLATVAQSHTGLGGGSSSGGRRSQTTTHLNRIGGADKFVLELAARCALQRLGTPGFNWSQIIVDEGFTHFDAARRSRIHDVVLALVSCGCFRQVVLTSHLDAVKQVCESAISIEVEGSSSRLVSVES